MEEIRGELLFGEDGKVRITTIVLVVLVGIILGAAAYVVMGPNRGEVSQVSVSPSSLTVEQGENSGVILTFKKSLAELGINRVSPTPSEVLTDENCPPSEPMPPSQYRYSLRVSPTAQPGTYTIRLQVHYTYADETRGVENVEFSLTVVEKPTFEISASPSVISIPRGGSDNVVITFDPPEIPRNLGTGFSGLPEEVECPDRWPQPPASYWFTLSVSENAEPDNYEVAITAENMESGFEAFAPFTLIIES